MSSLQEIQVDIWRKQTKLLAFYKCALIEGNTKCPGYVALSKTHLWILREIPHNESFASVAAKRPLDTIIQITSKGCQPDLIIFRYGYPNKNNNTISSNHKASDHLHIPQAFNLIRLIKREVVRIMDETTGDSKSSSAQDRSNSSEQATKNLLDKEQQKKRETEIETPVDKYKDREENEEEDGG